MEEKYFIISLKFCVIFQDKDRDMSTCQYLMTRHYVVLQTHRPAMYIKCREMEGKETMAMFEVKGSKNAEGQQTDHDLLGGIGKHSPGDTTWG